jgi:hypothetical protein
MTQTNDSISALTTPNLLDDDQRIRGTAHRLRAKQASV